MSDTAELFIDCRNSLGEGPLWHPARSELFWFDINANRMFRAGPAGRYAGRDRFRRTGRGGRQLSMTPIC